MISYWDDQYNFLFDRWFSRSAMSLDCKDCYFPYYCSYLNIILCSPIVIHYKVSYTRSCVVGWNRQLSTSPSRIDFHFSNYCLKPIMDIGKFQNFFCDSYLGPFSLASINLKKKWGRVWRWPTVTSLCLYGEAAGPGAGRPSEAGSASFWLKKNDPLHLVERLCKNRWVKVNRVGDVSGGAIGARRTRGVARCDRLNITWVV